MENEILKGLEKIEEENNIKIIFASDTGSRTLGYSTEESICLNLILILRI